MKEGGKEGRTAMNTNCCRMEGHQGRKDIKEGRISRKGISRNEGKIGRKEGYQERKAIKEGRKEISRKEDDEGRREGWR